MEKMALTSIAPHPGSRRRLILVATALWAAALVLLFITPATNHLGLWVRWGAIMLLAWWLPGALLVAHWRLPGVDLPTASVLAAGLGLLWMVFLLLLVHWWPGPISQWQLILAYAGGAAALGTGLFWRNPLPLTPTSAGVWVWVLVLLVLGAALRLPGLSYHEFHTDEVVVLTRAREALLGEDDALARHTKGPGELAIATVVYRTLDTANEGAARLPFALSSVVSIVAVALLGRSLFSAPAGIWAGVLLAVNGFALGLSRIAQYQPVVMLLSVLAILAAWEFARGGPIRWLALAATFGAWGLLLHYELALVWPALLLAAWFGWRQAPDKKRVLLALFGASALGGIVVAVMYLRAFLNPYFATTQSYLDTRMGGLGQTFNLAFLAEMATFYNSTYFATGLLLLVALGLCIGWRAQLRGTLLLIGWFLPYLFVYLLVVEFPGTHFYTIMPSWSLLAALPLAVLSTSPPRRRVLRYSIWGGLALWLVVSIYYLYLVFFRQHPEYVVNYEQERSPFYWAFYGENIPDKPRFGLPIKEGWGVLGVLAEWNYLTGSYASNEYSRHLRWYLGGLERVDFDAQPDFIFVAKHLQEPDLAFQDHVLDGYQRIGEVQVRGEARIAIWSQEVLPGGYVVYDAAQFADIFDGLVPALHAWPDPPALVHDITLAGRMTLVQAGVDSVHSSPGETLHVHLVWTAQQPLDHDYKLFVHLADATGRPAAQWDGLPEQNTAQTSQWNPGQTHEDHVLLAIPETTPPGDYTLRVGLYDPTSGERLGDRAVDVAQITVK
jgi:hypothetical protein